MRGSTVAFKREILGVSATYCSGLINQELSSLQEEREFMTVSQARVVLNFKTEKPLRRAISEGRLPVYRFGRSIRIKPSDLISSMKKTSTIAEILS
jgi:excisionase family DNA binding protein